MKLLTNKKNVLSSDSLSLKELLLHDSLVLRERDAEDEHNDSLTVPTIEPAPPNYYIPLNSNCSA
jgi:hypothetical protein